MSQSDIQAGFERLLSHCNPIAADVDLNPHPPLTIEWYQHALKKMEEQKHEAETRLELTEQQKREAEARLEESRRQVGMLREENQGLRYELSKATR